MGTRRQYLSQIQRFRSPLFAGTIYRNDRNGDGVLVAIKDGLKGIMVEESNSKRKEESIWLSLTNNMLYYG